MAHQHAHPGAEGPGQPSAPEPAGSPTPGASQPAGAPPRADVALQDGLSADRRVALHDATRAARVCEWCADRCIDEGPGMARCIRLCRDVADLARLYASLLARESVFEEEVARTFAAAAEECAAECRQHPHEHCQECARLLPRAARTARAAGGRGATGSEPVGQLPAGQQ